jgi:Zn-dependent peptidase ImmA (M78 family)
MTPKEKIAIIKDFVEFCENEINIEQLPKIKFILDNKWAKNLHSFGRYRNEKRDVTVYMGKRNLADTLRTLAHELVHHRQNELGKLDMNSGDTGSNIENEANVMAGILMRKFGKTHDMIYESKSLKLTDILKELKQK